MTEVAIKTKKAQQPIVSKISYSTRTKPHIYSHHTPNSANVKGFASVCKNDNIYDLYELAEKLENGWNKISLVVAPQTHTMLIHINKGKRQAKIVDWFERDLPRYKPNSQGKFTCAPNWLGLSRFLHEILPLKYDMTFEGIDKQLQQDALKVMEVSTSGLDGGCNAYMYEWAKKHLGILL